MSTYAYPNPQAIFYQQYDMARRDEVVGILLALFLGDFGVHHFYLRRTGLGILYLCFFWTGIPAILGFIECFFMPGRVREFNAIQAAAIAASLGIPVPGWGQPPVNVTINVPGNMPPAGPSAVPVPGETTYTPPPMPLALPAYPPSVMPVAVAQNVTCANCQRSNPLGARFCSGCGQAL
jgi:TM2 domain-containing membrane protein YozV